MTDGTTTRTTVEKHYGNPYTKMFTYPAVSALDGTEEMAIIQDNEVKSITVQELLGTSSHYHFHGFVGNQISDETKFFDISGNSNDGTFGLDLGAPWANAGYITTENPAGGDTDESIRLPAVNFDYNAGEKLIIWWLGKATPEGSNVSLLGDGFNTSYPGVRIRCNTAGTMQIAAHDASGQGFSSTPSEVPFDGNLHSFTAVLDGAAKKFGIWVDETYDASLSGVYATFDSGNARDTRTTNSFNIGTSVPVIANSTEGLVCQTRACVIMKLPPTATMPSVATVTNVFKAVRRNPGKLILASAF
jgi:hypothetical protein